ncbi:LAS superfamily LD-carboxypeptidase LdcB [Elusimicrobium posterum]|uniref:D-alanyl-D-alanine carboxypeptidase family protein n=1 Tax=Elusimicrobium posterum TaxID=3116653 RepID=UPI003C73584E
MRKLFISFAFIFIPFFCFAQQQSKSTITLEQALKVKNIDKNAVEKNFAGFKLLFEKVQLTPEFFYDVDGLGVKKSWLPVKLADITNLYPFKVHKKVEIRSAIEPPLRRMLKAAKDAGHELYVREAYRSNESQQYMKDKHGEYAAEAGFSQHQMGLAVDINNINKTLTKEQILWLEKNAGKYGFMRTYDGKIAINDYKNKSGKGKVFKAEAWHYRYFSVNGVDLCNRYFKGDWAAMLRFLEPYIREETAKMRAQNQQLPPIAPAYADKAQELRKDFIDYNFKS